MTRFLPVSVLVLLAVTLAPAPAPAQATADAALIQKARAIHDRVIALDTHDDIDPDELHAAEELHAAPRHAGQPARR